MITRRNILKAGACSLALPYIPDLWDNYSEYNIKRYIAVMNKNTYGGSKDYKIFYKLPKNEIYRITKSWPVLWKNRFRQTFKDKEKDSDFLCWLVGSPENQKYNMCIDRLQKNDLDCFIQSGFTSTRFSYLLPNIT